MSFQNNTIILISSLLLIITSCESKFEPSGCYRSHQPKVLEWMALKVFSNYDSRAVGCRLELKADSSFYYRTCSTESYGTWTCTTDSLKLNFHNRSWLVSTAEETYGPANYTGLLSYPIEAGKIDFSFISNNKKIYSFLTKD